MRIIKTIKEMQVRGRRLRDGNRSSGFVPTMGALHEGHLSLVRRSIDENDSTAVSIFVNPTQFGPDEDFAEYPRDLEGDLAKLESMDIDAVFIPEKGEMYPEGFSVSVDIGGIGRVLCGKSRPGHFNGVATVVAKLFNIVTPDRAYFGQKDFQQTVVIKKLVRELNFNTRIVVCPIIREPDGLAISSRNIYLSGKERGSSVILYKALKRGKDIIVSRGVRNPDDVRDEIDELIRKEQCAAVDYIEIVDPVNLEAACPISLPVVICLAVRIGKTRLIDNIIVDG